MISQNRRASNLSSSSRSKRRLSTMLAAFLLLSQASAFAGVNDPRTRMLYPADGDSRRSVDVPIVFAQFDRGLREGSDLELRDSSNALVPGIVRLNEPENEPDSWRTIEFLPTSALSEVAGPYAARARACPALGGACVIVLWSFEIDDTAPPAPTFSSPVNNSLVTSQTVTVSGNAEPGAHIWIFEVPNFQDQIATGRANESGSYRIELPYPNEDGVEHKIRAVAVDRAGNISPLSAQRRFIHDSLLLLPILTAPVEGSFLNTATIAVEGRAKANSTAEVLESASIIATATVAADQKFTTPVSFAHGSHTISVQANDGLLVDGPSPAVTFFVDLLAPGAPIVSSPLAGSSVGGPNVVVLGTGEPNARIRLRDAGDIIVTSQIEPNGTWSVSIARPDGPVSLTAEVLDQAGNVGPQTSNPFTVDSVAPVAPIISGPPTGSIHSTGTVVLSGDAEAGALVALLSNETVLGTTFANGSGTFSLPIAFADGTYTLYASAVDSAGNISERSGLVTFAVDTVAPSVPVIAQPFGGDTFYRVPISASGTAEAGSGVTIYEGSTVLGVATTTTDGTWTVPITVGTGSRTIHAVATDRAGNVGAASPTTTFTLDPGSTDVTPPAAPIISRPFANEFVHPVVLLSGSAEALSRVRIYEGATILTAVNADEAGLWGTTLMLTPGLHTITAKATDLAGNVGTPTPSRSFTVDADRPSVIVTSGTIADLILVLPTAEEPVSGTASDDTLVERIELETVDRRTNERRGPFLGICVSCPGQATAWSATIPVPPGFYRLEVYAVDVAGRRSLPVQRSLLVLDP